jgi:hypothetical protein
LKRDFKKDIDIVAVGSGIELALKVSQLLPNKPKVQVFKTYGTAMLRFEDTEIEFVGAQNPISLIVAILLLKTEHLKTTKIVTSP